MTSTTRPESTHLPRATIAAAALAALAAGLLIVASFLVSDAELASALRGIAAAVVIVITISAGADYARLVSARRARRSRNGGSLTFRDRFGHASPGDAVDRGYD